MKVCKKHVTTIAGPQAQAILSMFEKVTCHDFVDKSVPGLPIVEIWMEDSRDI